MTLDKSISLTKELALLKKSIGDIPKNLRNDSLLVNENLQKSISSINEGLHNLNSSSSINWEEIITRICIAAFTLFLCQIFYQIYRYNQNVAAYLHSKAQILELYKGNKDEKNNKDEKLKDLRSVLLAKLESFPRFEKIPSSILQDAIKIMSKNNKD